MLHLFILYSLIFNITFYLISYYQEIITIIKKKIPIFFSKNLVRIKKDYNFANVLKGHASVAQLVRAHDC